MFPAGVPERLKGFCLGYAGLHCIPELTAESEKLLALGVRSLHYRTGAFNSQWHFLFVFSRRIWHDFVAHQCFGD
jgi:hypothetical protein